MDAPEHAHLAHARTETIRTLVGSSRCRLVTPADPRTSLQLPGPLRSLALYELSPRT